MKRFIPLMFAVSCSCVFMISCGSSEEPSEEIIADSEDIVLTDSLSGIGSDIHQPDFICARHILISWDSTSTSGVLRTREEAQALVDRIQADILAGARGESHDPPYRSRTSEVAGVVRHAGLRRCPVVLGQVQAWASRRRWGRRGTRPSGLGRIRAGGWPLLDRWPGRRHR